MRFSLQTKIWAAVSSIVLVFSVFMLFFFPYQNTRNFEQYYLGAANSMAITVANSLEISLDEHNFIALEVIMDFIRKDSRLDFVTIAQPDTLFGSRVLENKYVSTVDSSLFSIEWNVFKSYPDSFIFSGNTLKNENFIIGSSHFHSSVMSGIVFVGFNKVDIMKNRDRMMTVSVLISSIIFLIGLYFSYLLSRSIARRVEQLRDAAIQVGSGNLSQKIPVTVNDEIGELAEAFNYMVEDLEEANTSIKEKTKALQSSYKLIEAYNTDITDSIKYGKRIQTAIMPQEKEVKKAFPDAFILNLPKDIVSGDFYWLKEVAGHTLLCVADCTGHGVPGAFMSLICTSLLQEATEESVISGPHQVFADVRNGLVKALQVEGLDYLDQQKEGMDAILIKWNRDLQLEFSAAYNPLLLIRSGEFVETQVDKQPVGLLVDKKDPFTKQQIELKRGDVVYLMTDGYQDQFGGKRDKKFKNSRLKSLLLEICDNPMEEQRDILLNRFNSWKGEKEQVDDVLIVGIRF